MFFDVSDLRIEYCVSSARQQWDSEKRVLVRLVSLSHSLVYQRCESDPINRRGSVNELTGCVPESITGKQTPHALKKTA